MAISAVYKGTGTGEGMALMTRHKPSQLGRSRVFPSDPSEFLPWWSSPFEGRLHVYPGVKEEFSYHFPVDSKDQPSLVLCSPLTGVNWEACKHIFWRG